MRYYNQSYRDSTKFDTSLFMHNDAELAMKVNKMKIGFRGMNNVKIPYAMAKSFVDPTKHSALRANLSEFLQWTFVNVKDGKDWWRRKQVLPVLEEYLTEAGNAQSFLWKLKRANSVLRNNGGDVVAFVYSEGINDRL
ncbi:MAG: hypothetical protein J6574_03950 [Gilliamella sp.]|nr:hypothetical protein [Gilliamella sp.]